MGLATGPGRAPPGLVICRSRAKPLKVPFTMSVTIDTASDKLCGVPLIVTSARAETCVKFEQHAQQTDAARATLGLKCTLKLSGLHKRQPCQPRAVHMHAANFGPWQGPLLGLCCFSPGASHSTGWLHSLIDLDQRSCVCLQRLDCLSRFSNHPAHHTLGTINCGCLSLQYILRGPRCCCRGHFGELCNQRRKGSARPPTNAQFTVLLELARSVLCANRGRRGLKRERLLLQTLTCVTSKTVTTSGRICVGVACLLMASKQQNYNRIFPRRVCSKTRQPALYH